jgi:hypothetical protein
MQSPQCSDQPLDDELRVLSMMSAKDEERRIDPAIFEKYHVLIMW